jgi:deoxycytidylate deaminase
MDIHSKFSRQEQRYLALAANLARSSEVPRYKHGAIIVKGGRIVSTGINKIRNHPTVFGSSPKLLIKSEAHIHAEADAIRKVSELKGAKIYVARVNRSGQVRFSRPCDMCYRAIVKSGIRKVCHT